MHREGPDGRPPKLRVRIPISLSYIDSRNIDEKQLAIHDEEPPATLLLEAGYSYRYPSVTNTGTGAAVTVTRSRSLGSAV